MTTDSLVGDMKRRFSTQMRFTSLQVQKDMVWIVGQRSDLVGETDQWTFVGVFTSKEKAIEACRDWTYFIGACNLDDAAPHEPTNDWLRDTQYPLNI